MRYTLCFLLALAASSGSAQTTLDSALLRYHCTRTSIGRSGDTVRRHSRVNILYSPHWLRTESSLRPQHWTVSVGKPGAPGATTWVTNGREYYKTEEPFVPELFRLGGWNSTALRFEASADTATIRGRFCRKAMLRGAVQGVADSIEVWYQPDTLVRAKGLTNVFADVPGLPVRFRFRDYPAVSIGGPRWSLVEYNLFEVEPVPQQPDRIEHAEKYQWLDESEKIQVLMRMMLGKDN